MYVSHFIFRLLAVLIRRVSLLYFLSLCSRCSRAALLSSDALVVTVPLKVFSVKVINPLFLSNPISQHIRTLRRVCELIFEHREREVVINKRQDT